MLLSAPLCCLVVPSTQNNDRDKYWQFAKMNHELSKNITLRGMLRFKPSPTGVCVCVGGGGARQVLKGVGPGGTLKEGE